MTGDPHPLEALRAQAAVTPPAQVRAELEEGTAVYRALLAADGWGAGAEDTLRRVIGMERKMGMEMRIGLGERAADLPHRLTAPLAEMGLPELLEEARATRTRTLDLLDRVLAAPDHLRVWTFGEEVEPAVYLLALRGRLERLAALVEAARLAAPGPT
ncbi:hypothetical protein [Deinococcus aestuarii]|uniref:hypothetical protein n=1 Tax=Deinococcus aestuarii TaxID=2774531 RepID=UPI001C0B99E6|nr:hypothetical protein [Deinococcus aestuarii]